MIYSNPSTGNLIITGSEDTVKVFMLKNNTSNLHPGVYYETIRYHLINRSPSKRRKEGATVSMSRLYVLFCKKHGNFPGLGAPWWVLLLGCLLVMPSMAEDRSAWPEVLNIGTASLGGTYAVYGQGLSYRITEELDLTASTQVTGGPYQNMILVHIGEIELGMVTLGPAAELWDGDDIFGLGEPIRDARALFPMYQTPFQVVALTNSGIASIADLEGKRVGVGPMGGTCAGYWPRFLETLGVDARYNYAGANELGQYLTMGLIDAFAFCAGLPISAFQRLVDRHNVTLFAFTEEEQAKLIESFPVAAFEIPAGIYKGQGQPQHSVAFWNFAIAHKDLPENLVYALMQLVLDDHEAMLKIHPAARETRAENLQYNAFLWFHPGAVRYYREQGLDIPEHLLPPELQAED